MASKPVKITLWTLFVMILALIVAGWKAANDN